MRGQDFITTDEGAVARASISSIDARSLEDDGYIDIHHSDSVSRVSGILAFDALMILKPSVLEGKRLKFAGGAWIAHNLIAHPAMQIVALAGMLLRPVAPQHSKRLYETAIAIHDITVPRPRNGKKWRLKEAQPSGG